VQVADSAERTNFNDERLLAYIEESTGFDYNLLRNVKKDKYEKYNLAHYFSK